MLIFLSDDSCVFGCFHYQKDYNLFHILIQRMEGCFLETMNKAMTKTSLGLFEEKFS